ncbi:MAG: HD domain-containing protein [SAR324 cluster bacterium]|nr:HD domain-containing protein [SAR324 cluster bacterium]
MGHTPAPLDILTPQGYLSEIQDSPNLDVLMNLFKIPRAFTVSGFGNWNVGQHSFCTAFLALYWSRFRGYDEEKRNELIVLAMTHDLHESATGDILPGLKNKELRLRLDQIQETFLIGLGVHENQALKTDLKILDIIAFMYEIQQAQTLNVSQKSRLDAFLIKQWEWLTDYCEENKIAGIDDFLKQLRIFHQESNAEENT